MDDWREQRKKAEEQLEEEESARRDEAILASRLLIPHTIDGSCGVKLNFPDLLNSVVPAAAPGLGRLTESSLIYVPPLRIASLPSSQSSQLPSWFSEHKHRCPAAASPCGSGGGNHPQNPSSHQQKSGCSGGSGYGSGPVWTYVEEASAHGGPSTDASDADERSSTSWDQSLNMNNNAADVRDGDDPTSTAASKSHDTRRAVADDMAEQQHDPVIYVTTLRVERSSTAKEFFGPGEVIGIQHFGTFKDEEDYAKWLIDKSFRPPARSPAARVPGSPLS